MVVSYRSAKKEDLRTCFELLGEPQVFYSENRNQIPELLKKWLVNGQMIAHVIEDISDLRNPRPVGFSVVVFIAETFARFVRDSPKPFVRAELARRELAGESLVLTPLQIRDANRTDGLSMLYFNQGLTNTGLDEEMLHQVHARWGDTFLELRGFNLKEIFCEVHSEQIQQMGIACGQYPRHTWKNIRIEAGSDPVDVFLIGTCNTQSAQNKGTTASYLFNEAKPRFGFTARQQELLKLAIAGETDTEMAGGLFISLPAVKKRWIAIYEQVSAREPGWLEEKDATGANGDSRGAEKRRRLLNYLRQHPEELHPANARAD